MVVLFIFLLLTLDIFYLFSNTGGSCTFTACNSLKGGVMRQFSPPDAKGQGDELAKFINQVLSLVDRNHATADEAVEKIRECLKSRPRLLPQNAPWN